jgi:ubiquinone/menaquinone biosynthesis C-methylase UbiE/NAD-dependent dihydropyrimidine dehydrogenase PreA subunit
MKTDFKRNVISILQNVSTIIQDLQCTFTGVNRAKNEINDIMFSYIFMKILEKRAERYDYGINILSGGHARRTKEEIVKTFVNSGITMLDIGCGTGELAIEAARAGATVTGIDISEKMLAVAQRRVEENNLKARITLHQAAAVEMDSLFRENTFDLVTATLVLSELSSVERTWVLNEIYRVLKPSGTFILADEVKPQNLVNRFFHFMVRLPLAAITYIIAQTGTKALADISEDVSQVGLEISSENYSFLGSFAVISAKKLAGAAHKAFKPEAKKARDDFSLLKSVWDYIGRWFPNPVEPGLREIGTPNKDSPVIVTANFHKTVREVEKSLKDTDCHLLVVPTNGINVWCAACGGDFTTHSIITAIKTSRIGEMVSHRQLILPQFSAPGIDRTLLKNETGWNAVFGPAYAKDIPSFLEAHLKKTPEQSMARFPFSFRLEMLISMNFLIWALMAFIALLFNPLWALWVSALFWGSGGILYAGYPLFPSRSGWIKAAILSVAGCMGISLGSQFGLAVPWWSYWRWMILLVLLNVWLGLDLKGIVAGDQSEAEQLLYTLGVKSLGGLFSTDIKNLGKIQQDREKCIDCKTCLEVCPKGVFGVTKRGDVILKNPNECFCCNACVNQCPSEALSIT